MFEKYIFINQETFKACGKQNKDGIWLCEKIEVSAKDGKELEKRYDKSISIMNRVHNKYNKTTKPVGEEKKPSSPKDKNMVRM